MSITKQQTKEAGMVSIMVTLILMIVLSLIVLGFAQVANRNQRQSLDRQLSTQAFYAAETGINDVRNLIATKGTPVPKPDCTNGSGAELAYYGAAGGLNNAVNASQSVSYTCVMVDPTPDTLAYNDVGTTGTVVPVAAASGTIGRLKLSWQSKDGTPTPLTGCPASVTKTFSPTGSWTCGYGVLRFDLVPTSGSLNIAALQNTTMSSIVVPLSSGGSATYGYIANTSGSNDVLKGLCTNTGCSLTITGLSSTQYYLRVSSTYKDASLQINIADAANNPLDFTGAQALIDSTGKAQDVLRRVQVHVPLATSGNQLPDYAIESTDSVCKRFAVMSNYFTSFVASVAPTIAADGNPLCN